MAIDAGNGKGRNKPLFSRDLPFSAVQPFQRIASMTSASAREF
jgi:hypothetical protein